MNSESLETSNCVGGIFSFRWLNFGPDELYAACIDPERLQRWWGPAGFSNTFHVCDPRPGGDWRFTMYGPDGTAFEMDNRFIELLPDERVVIGHDQPGHTFTLTIGLEPENGGTRLNWLMRFDPPEDAEPVRDAILAANEQNFDRLEAELARGDNSAQARGDSMNDMTLSKIPVMQTGMLIRRPADEVCEAFLDPAITSKFWFSKGTGRLEAGKTVTWEWEWYDIAIEVKVIAIEPGRRLLIEWPGYSGQSRVEWTFSPRPDGTTFVEISESGYQGDGDSLVKQVSDSTQGFSLVLAGLKAWLEHGIELRLVPDRFPPEPAA